MKRVPIAVITFWIPGLIGAGTLLFLSGQPLKYWSVCILVFPVLVYMNTLARVEIDDRIVLVKRWWGSFRLPKSEVLEIVPSMLEGVSVLRVRHFIPPWGSLHFLSDTFKTEALHEGAGRRQVEKSRTILGVVRSLVCPAILGASGFILGRAIASSSQRLYVKVLARPSVAVTASAIFVILFFAIRKRAPALANSLLFCAMFEIALGQALNR